MHKIPIQKKVCKKLMDRMQNETFYMGESTSYN